MLLSHHVPWCPLPGLAANLLVVRAHFAESAGHIGHSGYNHDGIEAHEVTAPRHAHKMSCTLWPAPAAGLSWPGRGAAWHGQGIREWSSFGGATVSKRQRKAP